MATTAWIFSYKLKKNVSEEQFIERTKSYTMRSSPKRKDLSPGNIIYRIKCGLTFVLWETEEDAHNATTVGQGKEVTENFYACIQMNTCRTLISQLVKKY